MLARELRAEADVQGMTGPDQVVCTVCLNTVNIENVYAGQTFVSRSKKDNTSLQVAIGCGRCGM